MLDWSSTAANDIIGLFSRGSSGGLHKQSGQVFERMDNEWTIKIVALIIVV